MLLRYELDMDPSSKWFLTTHGESNVMPLYLDEVGHFICGSRHFTERSGLDNYLMLYTVSGSGLLFYEEKELLLGPGCAAVIHCQNYQLYRACDGGWNYRWVHFNGVGAKAYYDILHKDGIHLIRGLNDGEMSDWFVALYAGAQKKDILSDAMINQALTDMLSHFVFLRFKKEENIFLHKEDMERAISYIESYFSKKFSLEALSSFVHISKFYLIKLFTAYTGMTPYDYLIHYRIIRAKELLLGSNESVNRIAERVGFSDDSNFIYHFKKLVGKTPLVYRKTNINY